ncbi:MAG: methyltransferase domain-containing protein [Candidatus Thorarchaeota archaeon]
MAIAEKVRELVAVDIDVKAIDEAQQRNQHESITFLVENIEDFNLGQTFDVILSIGVGYMYLKDVPSAIRCISHHLKDDGVFLAICSSPEDEYQRVVDLLVEENIRTTSFYTEFERILSHHFTFEKRMLKGELVFPHFNELIHCFERELREEYQTEMNDQHVQQLREYFQGRDKLSVEFDSQAYTCRNLE